MCGIVGAVFEPNAPAFDIERGLARIKHRGPDGSGSLLRDDVVFGHTRLAIIDLSDAAAQPMLSADGNVAITFNGEIYNHRPLRRELETLGRSFRSHGDTEVILEGYCQYGAAYFERLDGMFAFALFDFSRRTLFLVRDRVGKKPLFYAHARGSLRFASEIKSLFATGTPCDVDESALPRLFALGYVPPPHTLYHGVRQLPPATILELRDGGDPIMRRYWQPTFASGQRDRSIDEACVDIRRLLEDAIVRRLDSDVPVGAFLSGGIDSSIVVGLMARHVPKVRTFSIGFEGDARYDETRFARIAARAFGTEHTEFRLNPTSFDLLDRLVSIHDGPFGESSAVPMSVVAKLTREHVTVALGGDGGDELFCGYPRFVGAELAERVPRPLRAAAGAIASRLPETGHARTPYRRIQRLALAAARSLPERMLHWNAYFVDDIEQLLQPDLIAASPTVEDFIDAVDRPARDASPLKRALHFNFETYLPHDLLVKADRATMMHGLELRSPFLDTALVEYAGTLPDHFLRRGRSLKWILKRAFEDLLPTEILHRGKMGFGMPLGTWFRGSLREYVHDCLGPGARAYRYLRREHVESLILEHESGAHDREHHIWLLLTFERWLQTLDAQASK